MQITVQANNFELTDRLKKYAENKASRLTRYFNHILGMDLEFTEEAKGKKGNRRKFEITLRASGRVMRAEVLESSFYNAIDLAVDKLERQLKKYKSKLIGSRRAQGDREELTASFASEHFATTEGTETSDSGNSESEGRIVRTKTFSTKPMTCDEAVLQMELSGHPFFLFVNAETSQVNAVFKRSSGGYGMLVPADE